MKTITSKVKVLAICSLFSLFSLNIFAQVGIGNTNPAASSLLDIRDGNNNKGILIPRVSITNLNNASPVDSPVISLLVYNTNASTVQGFYYWDGGKWVSIGAVPPAATDDWTLKGNLGTNPDTDFVGTRDGDFLKFRVGNVDAGYLDI